MPTRAGTFATRALVWYPAGTMNELHELQVRLESDLLAKYPRGCRLDEEKSDALAMAVGLAGPRVGRVTELRWHEAAPGKLSLSLTLQQ